MFGHLPGLSANDKVARAVQSPVAASAHGTQLWRPGSGLTACRFAPGTKPQTIKT